MTSKLSEFTREQLEEVLDDMVTGVQACEGVPPSYYARMIGLDVTLMEKVEKALSKKGV